jgi:methyltransferase (TIGR00027 family)
VTVDSELRSVSDTALLVAAYRAAESERRRPLFRDPYARSLAGERGERLARELRLGLAFQAWPVIARTVVFDEVILRLATAGSVASVLNLAAGLDSRPYRLDLPAGLRWIEADLPAILEHKERLLAAERPRCRLERVPIDLAEPVARRRLLDDVVSPTLVLTEGLLVYLAAEDVSALALDLAGRPEARWWLLDLAGPAVLRWVERRPVGRQLAAANAAYRFAPMEGPDFFQARGWEPVEVRSSWAEARRLGRLPLALRSLEAATLPGERERYRDLARLVLLERPPGSG